MKIYVIGIRNHWITYIDTEQQQTSCNREIPSSADTGAVKNAKQRMMATNSEKNAANFVFCFLSCLLPFCDNNKTTLSCCYDIIITVRSKSMP